MATWTATSGPGTPTAASSPASRSSSIATPSPIANDQNHELEDGFFASPALADLDGDGKLEIVAAGMDGKLYVWNGDGSRCAGFPVLVQDTSLPDDPKADRRAARSAS